MSDQKKTVHAGHRARMFDKFERAGHSCLNFQPHETLEMFLFLLIPRVNTNETAHLLLDEFGTFEKVFHAPVEELVKIDGISRKTAVNLRFFGEIFDRVMQNTDKPDR